MAIGLLKNEKNGRFCTPEGRDQGSEADSNKKEKEKNIQGAQAQDVCLYTSFLRRLGLSVAGGIVMKL